MENTFRSDERALRLKRFILKYALYFLIGVVFIVYHFMTPLFLSMRNIRDVLSHSSPLLVAAIGMTFVLLIAEIDLSIGSIAGVSAAVWVVATRSWGLPLPLATLAALVCGGLLGGVNAFLIVKLNINSFMATLGMQIFLRGAVYLTVSGQQILIGRNVKAVLGWRVLGFSPLVAVSVLLAVFMMLVYRYTAFGRRVQAVGCNKPATVKVGINPMRVTAQVFVLMGVFAALAGIMQSANVGILNPSRVGDGMEFLAITASVLGGTSLFGGIGTIVPGALVGVIFLMSIENGLGLLGANPYSYPVIRGIIIYFAMLSDSLKRSIRKK